MSTTLNKYINFKSYIDKDDFYTFLKNANVSKPPVLILSGPRASGKSFVTAMIQKFYKSLGLRVCPMICQIQSSSDERICSEHNCVVINLKRILNPDFNAWKNLELDMRQIYDELQPTYYPMERLHLAPDSVREIYMNNDKIIIYSKDTLIAYAGFLLSEKNRHLEDIKNIDEKLSLLESKGITVDEEGPWIKEEVLKAQPIHR